MPPGPSGALHTCGAGSLFGSSACRFIVRPGPATAHRHRSLAPSPATRPHEREKVRPAPPRLPKIGQFALAGRVFSRRWQLQLPQNTRLPPHLKPMAPMRVAHCHEMKPSTPLRAPRRTRLKLLTPLLVQKSQFQAVFRPQRCHGFHAPLAKHPQRRRRFHQTNHSCRKEHH